MKKVIEDASDLKGYLFRILDNGGETVDRYTVAFSDGSYLGLSDNPSHPMGFSQWGEGIDPAWMTERVESGSDLDLALGDLPDRIVKHIVARVNQGYAELLSSVTEKASDYVAVCRSEAEVNDGGRDCAGRGIYIQDGRFMIRTDQFDGDFGPFETAREAILASLPDECAFSGPEHHPQVDLMRLEADEAVAAEIGCLEHKIANDTRSMNP